MLSQHMCASAHIRNFKHLLTPGVNAESGPAQKHITNSHSIHSIRPKKYASRIQQQSSCRQQRDDMCYMRMNATASATCTARDMATQDVRRSPIFTPLFRICALALVVTTVAWGSLALSSHAAAGAPASASSGLLSRIFNFVMHLDTHLTDLIADHGSRGVYGVLFAIVFAETGLVITPFLPGDSLLFAAGCLPALNFWALLATFITAASLGDAFNYMIGSTFGKKALQSNFIKGDYIAKTEKFYTKFGVKTIVLARFVPIVRTFAPFVAGIASMDYKTFAIYNVGGAVLWSVLLTGLGRAFGQLPIVQNNFSAVCAAIVVISLVPVLIEMYIARKEANQDYKAPKPS